VAEINGEEFLALAKRLPFFKKFSDDELKEILQYKNHIISYSKGKTIVRQKDIDLSLFVLIRGNVALTKNEKPNVKIVTLPQGSVFGEVSFLNPTPRITNVVADNEVTVLKLDGEIFERLSPIVQGKIKDKVIEMLATRLDNINNTLITYTRR
jgi:CRP-like cAMP-binding protein